MSTSICDLASKHCEPCQGGVQPLKGKKLATCAQSVPAWEVVEEHHITRTLKFPDFLTALDFVNKVGQLAEQENHHPEITFTWGRVRIDLHTHKIGGLSENDFILAAKIDQLPAPEPAKR